MSHRRKVVECASQLSGLWHRVSIKTPKQLKAVKACNYTCVTNLPQRCTLACIHFTNFLSSHNYTETSEGSSLDCLLFRLVPDLVNIMLGNICRT